MTEFERWLEKAGYTDYRLGLLSDAWNAAIDAALEAFNRIPSGELVSSWPDSVKKEIFALRNESDGSSKGTPMDPHQN